MSETLPFELLFQDEHFVAINKPPGILVHLTRLSQDKVSIVQQLSDQLDQRLFPVHRLDRATSGVLIFGLSAVAAGALSVHIREKEFGKKYLAVLRGYVEETGTIDYALSDPETGKDKQSAVTHYRRLGQSELPFSVDPRHPTTRYALVEAEPETGRRHQLRKHFAHILHPIIGDKRRGDVKQNTYLGRELGLERMLLHATELAFQHPLTGVPLLIQAGLDAAFQRALEQLELHPFLPPDLRRG